MKRHRRLAAWLITGPVGHFAGGAADWVTMLLRYWKSRIARADDRPRDLP